MAFYIQLTEVEQAFKELKHDLAMRPIFHHHEHRIEAHIFVAFLAYCLQVTLKAKLRPLAGGITPREVMEKFRRCRWWTCIPTTDGRDSCCRAIRSLSPSIACCCSDCSCGCLSSHHRRSRPHKRANKPGRIGLVVKTFGLVLNQIKHLAPVSSPS